LSQIKHISYKTKTDIYKDEKSNTKLQYLIQIIKVKWDRFSCSLLQPVIEIKKARKIDKSFSLCV